MDQVQAERAPSVNHKIYAIGIGGTGAKCIEALTYLSAIGLFGNSDLKVLLVDADATNGNSQRTRECINLSQEVRKHFNANEFNNSDFMLGNFSCYPSWNPLEGLAGKKKMEEIFELNTIRARAQPLGDLFDSLYSPDERNSELNVGFRGRPPIGSAVISRLRLSEPTANSSQQDQRTTWDQFLYDVKADSDNPNSDVTIHIFGSIFGGTGAAGIPTLARILDERLKGNKGETKTNYRQRIRLNATLLLPYFEFDRPNDQISSVFAESKDFPLNTQAALQYFTNQSYQSLDNVYLVGNNHNVKYSASTGNETQNNEANIVEVYAALAVAHGISGAPNPSEFNVSYISRASTEAFVWTDLPSGVKEETPNGSSEASAEKLLPTAVRFAYAWRHNFALELKDALRDPSQFSRGAPWFSRFFKSPVNNGNKNTKSIKDEYHLAEILSKWCDYFLLWVSQVGETTSTNTALRLFSLSTESIKEDSVDYTNDLAAIVRDKIAENRDSAKSKNLEYIKNKLADQSVASEPTLGVKLLAHSLFRLC